MSLEIARLPTPEPYSPPEDLGHETIKLLVGPKRKEFTVHKKLICDSSDFFAKAFKGNFKEAGEGVMYLPEDKPNAISLYVQWLYRESLPTKTSANDLMRLYQLYTFANKICDDILRDKVMDSIQDTANKHSITALDITKELVTEAFRTPLGDEGLSKFTTELMVYTYCFIYAFLDERDSKSLDPWDNVELDRFLQKIQDLYHDDFRVFRAFQIGMWENFSKSHSCDKVADSDPRDRDEKSRKDRCFCHCHEKNFDCRNKKI